MPGDFPPEPSDWLRCGRFAAFTRDSDRLGLDDASLRALELQILDDPTQAPVIAGTGGLRKARLAGLGPG